MTEISFLDGEGPKLFLSLIFAPLSCCTSYTSGRADSLLLYPLKCNIYHLQPELIVKDGYPAESHTVQTVDGYILTMHRIPYGKGGARRADRPPILLQHGVLSSSADWVVSGPGTALGDT
jgi:hypothetical protein